MSDDIEKSVDKKSISDVSPSELRNSSGIAIQNQVENDTPTTSKNNVDRKINLPNVASSTSKDIGYEPKKRKLDKPELLLITSMTSKNIESGENKEPGQYNSPNIVTTSQKNKKSGTELLSIDSVIPKTIDESVGEASSRRRELLSIDSVISKTIDGSVGEASSRNNALEKCTVKEILNGLLDCKVLRTPSAQNLKFASERLRENDNQEIQHHTPGMSLQYSGCTTSKMVTVKEILGEILDYTVVKKCNAKQIEHNDVSGPSTSGIIRDHDICRSELEMMSKDYRLFRAGLINSSSALHNENYIQRKSLSQILPSYSTVLRMGPKHHMKTMESFIPRQPPPSYSEVEGLWEETPTLISSESLIFGPDPIYAVCPSCRMLVVTDVRRERSTVTHLVAFVLCLFFCWPCCLLPYCLKSCNYSYHSCPQCRHYFGVYDPF
ncbi:hypothetical protein JTB14_026699 [Gonioctena quinquepunctata]|nr:hypothetical protein JTB14_026699 [Gonioctena quinquepunctata]